MTTSLLDDEKSSMVIVDTTVWSAFLRRDAQRPDSAVEIVRDLVRKNQVQLLGIVKQELLSGIRHGRQFSRLAEILKGFPLLLATEADHDLAVQFFNRCRTRGVQGSHIDFLICAQAVNNRFPILTADGDFSRYSKTIPIELVAVA